MNLQQGEEPESETQPVDQPQTGSQVRNFGREIREDVWGTFFPLVKDIKEVDLFKPGLTYRIGRNASYNNVVFPGFKISNKHAEITWDGRESKDSIIKLTDMSSNGTFVNGQKLGKGVSCILTDGAEVAFGSTGSSSTNPAEDYRFIFRHSASGKQPEDGFYGLYDSHDQLGRGTFASVVRCLERKTGILWAAKMFSNLLTTGGSGSLGSRSNEKMVSREISILETLSHPNVCFLKETFITDAGKLILVLELIEGGDLLEYILSNSGVSEQTTQHIAYQLCLALSYVHSLGIAHRDLKPEVRCDLLGNPPNIKVADFGLAKAIDSQTMLKTMCGTPAYLAPEIVMQTNMQGYDNLVDSWSVGAIVFSMLTNASPFIEDETQPDIRVRISTRSIDWRILKEKMSNPMIIDFIESLLTADPEARMTLTGALDHPWLQDYVKRNNRDAKADRNLGQRRNRQLESSDSFPTGGDLTPTNDNEERLPGSAFFSNGFQNLAINDENQAGPSNSVQHAGPSSKATAAVQIQGGVDEDSQMDDATPPPPPISQTKKLQAQNSRVLRRRKDILEEANAGETTIPRPSPELLSQFDEKRKREEEQSEAGPSNTRLTPEKRHGKRAHGDLTTVPENTAVNGSGSGGGMAAAMVEDASMNDMDGSADESVAQPTPSKRRRNAPPSAKTTTRAKRGKNNAEPVVAVRRSSRNKST
ncbi:Pkinase-domain-containing protein [Lentinula aciculospora]|uniref:Pkinase-domain-containing protein n=1 Tax=Lentinula aciculospora TaxID=153920 RepID=A0A9W9AUK5_9AGAR|nr:Pkinase-domain-containing protein [Lentinula aciculospora]